MTSAPSSSQADPQVQTPPVPVDIAGGDVVVSLAVGVGGPASPAPQWIKIAPRGRITTRRGGTYSFDPEKLSARFQSDGVSIPIDFEHATVHLASKGERADAIGWIDALEARQDGVYARVEWLDAGKAALSARTHRYVSPTFQKEPDGTATWFHSVALVTAPDLMNMPALAHAAPFTQPQPEKPMTTENSTNFAALAAALGLAADANEAAVLSAIADLKGGKVSKEIHEETLAQLSAASAKLNALEAQGRKAKVDGLLDEALKAKRIVPAQRDAYAALCSTDEGFEQVKALIAATPATLAASGLDEKRPTDPSEPSAEFDPVMLGAKAGAYLAAQHGAGNMITYVDAFAHVEREAAKEARS